MEEEQLDKIVGAVKGVRDAITPFSALPGRDETGGVITSLTEAVMGMTAGLVKIADSISELAAAVRERNDLDRR